MHLACLPLLLGLVSSAHAGKAGVPGLAKVLADSGWEVAPDLSAGIRAGDVFAVMDGGPRLVVSGCIGAVARESDFADVGLDKALSLGVRVGAVRLGGEVAEAIQFSDTVHAALPASALQPTPRCRDDLGRAIEGGVSLDDLVVVQEVLLAKIEARRAVGGKAKAVGAPVGGGARSSTSVSSDAQVAVGWRTVLARELPGFGAAAAEATGPLARPVIVDPSHPQARSIEGWWKGCRDGRAADCDALGASYLTGEAVAEDGQRGRALALRSCNGGHMPGCLNLGVAAYKGLGGKVDASLAAEGFEAACNGGEFDGCAYLGLLYEDGLGRPRDVQKAFDLYKKACTQKSGKGCLYAAKAAGRYTFDDGTDRDAFLFEHAELACTYGSAQGCSLAGVALSIGYRKSPDSLRRARVLLQQGCDGGDPSACYDLGKMLREGKGGAVDKKGGRALVRQACTDGYETACGD